MTTVWQRLRFASMIRISMYGLFARDTLFKALFPRSYTTQIRRAAAAHAIESRCFATSIPVDEGVLEGRFATSTQPPAALVLICHGIGDRLYFWSKVQTLLATAGFASLVFHYAGYGRSQGHATPENFEADTRAAYAHLAALAPGTPLFILGTSLGSAIAVQVASSLAPPPAGVVLSQAFTSLRQAAGAVIRRLYLPLPSIALLMPDIWRSANTLSLLDCPILIVHSAADELFPASMGEQLYAAAATREKGTESFVSPPGFAHGDVCLRPEAAYWEPILAFLRAHSSQRTSSAEAATTSPTRPSSVAAMA